MSAMLHRMDWDRYWRFELFRRAVDPVDFRKWKRDSQRALRGLYPGSIRLLDSSAGLGDHTVNLAEEGFETEACDVSPVALEATRRAVEEAKLEVPVFDAKWEELERPGRYDLIFNDALHWIDEPEMLEAVLTGLFAGLKPGGALVFFFADAAHPEPGYGRELLAWDWEHGEPERVAWDHTHEGRRVTLSLLRERSEDHFDEHHVYLDRKNGETDLETLTMRHVYRWDWAAIGPLLQRVGFVDLRSDHFDNIKGYRFAMSRAFRPR